MAFTKLIQKRADDLIYIVEHELNEYTPSGQRWKGLFLRTGRSVLTAIAKHLQLKEYKVHINKAGIAVSGDVTLIGMFDDENGIYISMSDPNLSAWGGEIQFLYRRVNSMKDYGGQGGRNQWMAYSELADLEEACHQMKLRIGALQW